MTYSQETKTEIAVRSAYYSLVYMGDFETCSDPRAYIKTSNRLLDACLAAGMSHDEPCHETWASSYVTSRLLAA